MANSVYEVTEIALMDGTKIKMRPLKISLLREFMAQFQTLTEVQADNAKSIDVLMDCVQIAMKQYLPSIADDREKIEDIIDLPSVYKIIEAASGIKFDDKGNVEATGIVGTN